MRRRPFPTRSRSKQNLLERSSHRAGNHSRGVERQTVLSPPHPCIDLFSYEVVADPPGVKIGNGGATFHALEEMERKFGDQLDGWRVCLLNAGGYSKRLANVSVIGKIFTALPLGM